MMTAEPGGFVETSDGTLVHFIDLDLHAEALRTDVADPILLIHGLVCNWHHWSRQLGGLAHSRRVVAVDVRGGAGKTRWLRPGWSTADMAADIHSVTTHLGLRRPAVVGCSMGGTIALQYALDYPLDISRLVVLASFAGLPHEMSRTVERQRAYIRSHTLGEIARGASGIGVHRDCRRGPAGVDGGHDCRWRQGRVPQPVRSDVCLRCSRPPRRDRCADDDHPRRRRCDGARRPRCRMARRNPRRHPARAGRRALRQRPSPGKGQSAAGERAANTARSCPAAVGDLTSVAGVRF